MKSKIFDGKDRGLTLVEALVAMTIFLITLAFMMPLFTHNHLEVIRRQIDTEAVSVSQSILDELRQKDIKTLPLSGTDTKSIDIESTDKLSKRTYIAKIIYCESNSDCDQSTREIKVQVNYNGKPVYTAKTLYTQFE